MSSTLVNSSQERSFSAVSPGPTPRTPFLSSSREMRILPSREARQRAGSSILDAESSREPHPEQGPRGDVGPRKPDLIARGRPREAPQRGETLRQDPLLSGEIDDRHEALIVAPERMIEEGDLLAV